MKHTTNAELFDSNAVGREIAKQLLNNLPPQALEKLNRRIRARRAQALKAQGERS
jgi:hypothetical protein